MFGVGTPLSPGHRRMWMSEPDRTRDRLVLPCHVPPAALSLKVGCITSITRNLFIEDALVMNAREVVALRPNVIQIRLLQQGAIRRRARVWPTCRLSSFRGSASSSSDRVRIRRSSVASSHSNWHMPPRSTVSRASRGAQ